MLPKYNQLNPELLNSIVCFTDILGFSNLVMQAPTIQEGNKLLKDLHLVLNDQYSLMRVMNPYGQFKTFTDNVILAYPIMEQNDSGEGETGDILMSFIDYQLNMVLKEYFVRGGIAKGEYYGDPDFAYGPALIEAYKLESEEATYPRIVLSQSMVKLVSRQLDYYGDFTFAPQYSHLLKDEDGKCFINYLVGLEEMFQEDHDTNSYLRKIKIHKQIVENKLLLFKGNQKLYSKYEWVAQYHNYYCEEYFGKSSAVSNNLLINNIPLRNFQRIASSTLIYI